MQISAKKAIEDGHSTWTPAVHAGDQKGVPGAWSGPGSALDLVAVKDVIQHKEGRQFSSLSFQLSLLLCFQIYSFKNKVSKSIAFSQYYCLGLESESYYLQYFKVVINLSLSL